MFRLPSSSVLFIASAAIIVLAAAVGTTAVSAAGGAIPIHQHSLEPPLLVNYEESGMPFWTLGGATVVTNDYVRLTPKSSAGHGYLWNRHPANMIQGQINFTIRASARTGFHLFGNGDACTTCGTAFWHVADASRHDRSNFFGIPNRFRGVGLVFPTTGNLYLVQSDGQNPVQSLQEVTLATCSFGIDDTPRTISITFGPSTGFSVVYFPANRPTYVTPCAANIQPNFVEHRYYFGFTSQFTHPQSVGTDIMGMSATGALDPKDDVYAKENFQYDPADEQRNKKLWNGAPDEQPKKDAAAANAAPANAASGNAAGAPAGGASASGADGAAAGGGAPADGGAGDQPQPPARAPEEPQF
jgi:hypothetical protein